MQRLRRYKVSTTIRRTPQNGRFIVEYFVSKVAMGGGEREIHADTCTLTDRYRGFLHTIQKKPQSPSASRALIRLIKIYPQRCLDSDDEVHGRRGKYYGRVIRWFLDLCVHNQLLHFLLLCNFHDIAV